MQYKEIVSKFGEFLIVASDRISRWLEARLPKVTKEWWQECVVDKLSDNQIAMLDQYKWEKLSDLDLSVLLRITDRNWYAISQHFNLRFAERTALKEMFSVRNTWAHPPASPPIVCDTVFADIERLNSFFQVFADSKVVREVENNFLKVLKNEGLTGNNVFIKRELEQTAESDNEIKNTEININSQVRVKSTPDKIGIVTAIKEIAGTKQYSVFIDGGISTYYSEQIELVQTKEEVKTAILDDLLCALSAYQINKPSSDSLYSLNSARIDFVPYQFRPALKLIKSDTPRLLIADSVGVGKTIEAGLILKEMQARTPLDSVLIICPKPLVAEKKWATEMKRFDEEFEAVDGSTLRQIIKDADRDGEWPDKYKRLIIPYSLLTEDLLDGKTEGKRKILGLKQLEQAPFFDMVIVDEAHHIRNSNTQAHKAVKFFCEHSNAAVFLTATPIQLGNEDLYSLLNLLFPDVVRDKATFNSMSEPNPFINKALHYLRANNNEAKTLIELNKAIATDWGRAVIQPNPLFQNAIALLNGGQLSRDSRVKLYVDIEGLNSFWHMINRTRRNDVEDFCVRRAYTVKNEFTDYQSDLHNKLLEFEADAFSILYPTMPLKFLMSTISRQASSCIFGLAPTIRSMLDRRFNDLSDENEVAEPEEGVLDTSDLNKLRVLAESVLKLADNLPSDDTKFDELEKVIVNKQLEENNKIILFSTFRHTLNYLYHKLKNNNNIRIEQVNGSIKDEERYRLRERFALPKSDLNALDVLLFTEVGSEGLDYQFCDTIINYDLPWNPMRIEQRIGRIDRRGQKSEIAHIFNCITKGTIDEEIYERCLNRIGVFEQSIGDCSDILGTITNSIKDIVYDSHLTELERKNKLEHLADNEIRKTVEMRKIEDDERQMFGVDISDFTTALEQAENVWLAPEAIQRLVLGYLHKRLNANKKYIDKNRLIMNSDEKAELLSDYRKIGGKNDTQWVKFLRGGNSSCNIAFVQEEAQNPKTHFINVYHPLVRQAAKSYMNDEATQIAIKTVSSDIPSGEYPFQIYAWEHTGSHPKTKVVAVCNNESAQKELPSILQNATEIEYALKDYSTIWDELEILHYEKWKMAKSDYCQSIQESIRFKVESLTKSTNARKNIALSQLNDSNDAKIILMRQSEIARLERDYELKKTKYESLAASADIHTTKIISGVLIVEG